MSQSNKYREVYELYQLCSNSKDLKEFCIDAGVNYNKFREWQRKQLWNEKLGRMEEKQFPVMSPVTLTDVPTSASEEMKILNLLFLPSAMPTFSCPMEQVLCFATPLTRKCSMCFTN